MKLMKYFSTRGGDAVTASQAIVSGIAPSGGLYVPQAYPALDVAALAGLTRYADVAAAVMGPYLSDTDAKKLGDMIGAAYRRVDTPEIVPVVSLTQTESIAELWHGPTMAFKDVALQMLPHLLTNALQITGVNEAVYILVATSGDTGKAALEGFAGVEGTRVLVFYPDGGVSEAQRRQMVTQEGRNVDVCAVRGNFDDAQTGVKQIFADPGIRETLKTLGYRLSSANSINFGRLLPQIVYYFTSYLRLVHSGRVASGAPVNFCVPTGNFGDILAGEYARRMGLPVHKLICASNRNKVLTDFFATGVYDDKRPFYRSMSCSIDILISSNLERLLYELADRDTAVVVEWMRRLQETGRYEIGADAQRALSKTFAAGWCSEADTLAAIRRVYDAHGYLMDPHTAVAQTVYEQYVERTGDATQTVLLSTANPYKFATDVLSAFEPTGGDDFKNADRLHEITGLPVPEGIAGLRGKPERFLSVCDLADMPRRVVGPVRPDARERG